jgi:hypothetical protein
MATLDQLQLPPQDREFLLALYAHYAGSADGISQERFGAFTRECNLLEGRITSVQADGYVAEISFFL